MALELKGTAEEKDVCFLADGRVDMKKCRWDL